MFAGKVGFQRNEKLGVVRRNGRPKTERRYETKIVVEWVESERNSWEKGG